MLRNATDGRTMLVEDPRPVRGDAMRIDEAGGSWTPAAQMNRTTAVNGGTDAVQYPTTICRLPIDAEPRRN